MLTGKWLEEFSSLNMIDWSHNNLRFNGRLCYNIVDGRIFTVWKKIKSIFWSFKKSCQTSFVQLSSYTVIVKLWFLFLAKWWSDNKIYSNNKFVLTENGKVERQGRKERKNFRRFQSFSTNKINNEKKPSFRRFEEQMKAQDWLITKFSDVLAASR